MEKDRSARVIAIVALIIGVVGLTIGFAAMNATLTISSEADVTPPEEDFTVQFSTNSSTITGTTVTTSNTSTGATGDSATITNGTRSSTLEGVSAHFTDVGQSVTYTFYAVNGGKYTAYLNSIAFANVTSESSFKVCTPGNGTTSTTVNATSPAVGACDGISLTISVGSLTNVTPETTGIDSISSHSLAPLGESGNGEQITVTITYAANATRADGPFDVDFGDITLTYGAVD